MTKYDIAGTADDKYIAYNAFNQPTKIIIGTSLADPSPVAVDEFAYGPDGRRFARRSTWQEGGNTITEKVSYVGPLEVISDDSNASLQTIAKTRVGPNVMHVKILGTVTEEFFEYAHRDHLGSIEVVTDENGFTLDNLAFEPFGSRKSKNWTSNISSTELDVLLDLDWDHPRKVRGFTGHEHLDRTGFIHMNGRVFDPVLGRFLSPDPVVQYPDLSQSWNRYSYVMNNQLSRIDPTGFNDDNYDDYDPPGHGGNVNWPWGSFECTFFWVCNTEWRLGDRNTDQYDRDDYFDLEPPEPYDNETSQTIFDTARIYADATFASLDNATLGLIPDPIVEFADPLNPIIDVSEAVSQGDFLQAGIAGSLAALRVKGPFAQKVKAFFGSGNPTKLNRGGVPQPYDAATGRYLSHNANPGLGQSPAARTGSGFSQGFAQGYSGVQGVVPVGRSESIAFGVGEALGKLGSLLGL